jgi:hypothetical protein
MLVQTGAMVAYENHMFPYNMCSSHASTKPAKKKKKYKKGSSWAIVMDAIFYGFGEEMDCNKDGSWQGFCVEFKF